MPCGGARHLCRMIRLPIHKIIRSFPRRNAVLTQVADDAPISPPPTTIAPPLPTNATTSASAQSPDAAPARLGWHLEGLALHIILAIVLTWPLLLNLGSNTLVPGVMEEDRAQNLWNLWWVKVALLEQH